MTNTTSNLILIALFIGIGIWVGIGFMRTHNKITIKDKLWNLSRILFLVAALFTTFTLVSSHDWLDLLRTFITVAVILLFIATRDGIGEEGVSSFGRFIPYKDISGYDYRENKNDFSAYFTFHDGKERKSNEYNISIPFEKDKQEQVKQLLKEKIGRKYVRMKKN